MPEQREPTVQELKKLAQDALSDSLEIYRWGLVYKLDIRTRSFDSDRDFEYLKKFPGLEKLHIQCDFSDLNDNTIFHVAQKLFVNSNKNEGHSNSEVYKTERVASIAHHKARVSLGEVSNLKGAITFRKLIEKLSKNIGWKNGLMDQDILDIYINRILSPSFLAMDFDVFIKACSKIVTNPKLLKSQKSIKLFSCECNKLFAGQISKRSNDFDSAIKECFSLQHLEHEMIFDPGIDSGCTSLGFYRGEVESGSLKFILGRNGEFNLSPPFDYALRTVTDMTSGSKLKYNESEDAYTKSSVSLNELGIIEKSHPIIPRPDEEINEELDRQSEGLSLLSGTRGLIVWRGSKYSFTRAVDEINILLPSSIRTAWLVTGGSKEVLGYLMDPLYRNRDFGNRSARVAWQNNQPLIPNDIEDFPNDFPVFKWIQYALAQAFEYSKQRNTSPQFLPGALRLLQDADKQLNFSPRQSFACSMAAAEICLGGKNAGSDQLARRMSRLLVAKNDHTRTKGMNLFKCLYGFRSKIVHGAELDVSLASAIFMRYVASCVVFNFAAFSKFVTRNQGPEEDSLQIIWKLMDDDDRGSKLLTGVSECRYLIQLIEHEINQPDDWPNINVHQV